MMKDGRLIDEKYINSGSGYIYVKNGFHIFLGRIREVVKIERSPLCRRKLINVAPVGLFGRRDMLRKLREFRN